MAAALQEECKHGMVSDWCAICKCVPELEEEGDEYDDLIERWGK